METGSTGWNSIGSRAPEPAKKGEANGPDRDRFQDTVEGQVRAEEEGQKQVFKTKGEQRPVFMGGKETLDEQVDQKMLQEVLQDGYFSKTISGTRAGMHTRVSHQAKEVSADGSFNLLSASFGKEEATQDLSIMEDPFGQRASKGKSANALFLGRDKNVIQERLSRSQKDVTVQGKEAKQTSAEQVSMMDAETEGPQKALKLSEGESLLKSRAQGKDGNHLNEALLLKSLDAASGQNGFTTNMATASNRVMTSIVQHIQTDPTLFLTVYPEYARVSIEVQNGEKLNLEMRMKDGCADVRAVGQSASILEGKSNELRQALEEAGMTLGEFSLESHESEQHYDHDDDQQEQGWKSKQNKSDQHDAVSSEPSIADQTVRRQKLEGRNHWVTA